MIMSINKAKVHPIIGPILLENPECFTNDGTDDWEQLILTFYIFYEMTFGQSSYWYPYLRLMPDVKFISYWSKEDLLET